MASLLALQCSCAEVSREERLEARRHARERAAVSRSPMSRSARARRLQLKRCQPRVRAPSQEGGLVATEGAAVAFSCVRGRSSAGDGDECDVIASQTEGGHKGGGSVGGGRVRMMDGWVG